jgi:hypothetical protein
MLSGVLTAPSSACADRPGVSIPLATDRDRLDPAGLLLGRQPLPVVDGDHPGTERVHPDAPRREVDGHRAGERVDGALHRVVGDQVPVHAVRAVAADVDDAAPHAAPGHDPRRLVGAVEEDSHVRAHVGVPPLARHGEERAVFALVDEHLRVVDEDVEGAELAEGLVEEARDLGLDADVARECETRAARLPNLLRGPRGHIVVLVVDDHPRPLPSESERDASTDAPPRAGDDRDLVAQEHDELLRCGCRDKP